MEQITPEQEKVLNDVGDLLRTQFEVVDIQTGQSGTDFADMCITMMIRLRIK